MENAADALKMAAAVLIFVLALSISINAFGEARQTSQTILDYKDREYDYTYVEESGTTQRQVNLETIVPSIYRAYKENYKIVFDIAGIDSIYRKKNGDNFDSIKTIDLQNQVLGTETQKEEFIKAILYGNKIEGFNEISNKFLRNSGIQLNAKGIYDTIKEKGDIKIIEKLGVYYQEDEVTSGSQESESSESTPDTNKTTKRVITYTTKI